MEGRPRAGAGEASALALVRALPVHPRLRAAALPLCRAPRVLTALPALPPPQVPQPQAPRRRQRLLSALRRQPRRLRSGQPRRLRSGQPRRLRSGQPRRRQRLLLALPLLPRALQPAAGALGALACRAREALVLQPASGSAGAQALRPQNQLRRPRARALVSIWLCCCGTMKQIERRHQQVEQAQLELLRRQPEASGNRLQQVGLPLALVQHRPLELSRSGEPLPHLRPRLEVGLVVADVAPLSLRHSFEVWCEITFWIALHSNKRLNHS